MPKETSRAIFIDFKELKKAFHFSKIIRDAYLDKNSDRLVIEFEPYNRSQDGKVMIIDEKSSKIMTTTEDHNERQIKYRQRYGRDIDPALEQDVKGIWVYRSDRVKE